MKDVINTCTYLPIALNYLVELCIISRDRQQGQTQINILNFDQVDSFVKAYAPPPSTEQRAQ